MIVREFIEWLKTQDQDAVVNVFTCGTKYEYRGKCAYTDWFCKEVFSPTDHSEYSAILGRELTLGRSI